VDQMAEELEKAMWARYIRESHSYRDFVTFKTADTPDFVGKVVWRRLLSLAIPHMARVTADEEQSVSTSGELLPRDAVDVATVKLFKWATNYQPRSFLGLKQQMKALDEWLNKGGLPPNPSVCDDR